jgi:hypothetical protein
MAYKMPGRAAQTASGIPGAVFHEVTGDHPVGRPALLPNPVGYAVAPATITALWDRLGRPMAQWDGKSYAINDESVPRLFRKEHRPQRDRRRVHPLVAIANPGSN